MNYLEQRVSENLSAELVRFFTNPASYPYSVEKIKHIETHISHVFIAGPKVYKIKKPVNLGFLDYSTPQKRHEMVVREFEINRRFAEKLYLGVQPIWRSPQGALTLAADHEAVDYAVEMRQFDAHSLYSELIDRGALTASLVLKAVTLIAAMHHASPLAPPHYGSTSQIAAIIFHCVEILEQFGYSTGDLREELTNTIAAKHDLIEKRRHGFVRTVHGDLHLGNICLLDGEPTLFDAIEFNPLYNSIDTYADIAFFIMDLAAHGREDLATIARNRYLELTDDFEGLQLLPLYTQYRALVRAKVAALNAALEPAQRRSIIKRYLDKAKHPCNAQSMNVTAIGGLSGSGKSVLAQELAKHSGAVIIRSDAVRKHIIGIDPYTHAPTDAYQTALTKKTYAGIFKRAAECLEASFPLILDAVFLSEEQRHAVEQLAQEWNIPFRGLWCVTHPAMIEKRLQARTDDVSDATWEVYQRQALQRTGQITWTFIENTGPIATVVEKLSLHDI
jgi:aminoglycoside phosphotransferase family enzyme/predicted kinase